MFTKPSVNQIEQAYTGNYQPLAQKVDQDKKQHGGIPHDLRQLLALNDIMENRESAGIQQALNAPVDMPTVAQSMQQMAQQAIQARMMQQVQEQQRKDGKPMTVPPGVPQPDMQPRGIDSIPTDVGSGYAAGGIIGDVHHFTNGGSAFLEDLKGLKDKVVGAFTESDEDKEARRLQQKLQQEGAGIGYFTDSSEDYKKKAAVRDFVSKYPNVTKIPEFQADPVAYMNKVVNPYVESKDANNAEMVKLFKQTENAKNTVVPGVNAPPAANVKPPAPPSPPKPATTRDSAPMPAGERPAGGLDQYLATPQKVLTTAMNVDPNQEMKDRMAMYNQMVGQQPTTGIDRMMAELERRKAKIEGEEPKPGFGGLMDYLGHIAGAGGKRWQDAGYAGSVSMKNAQKAREEQINALIEKGIDLGQKKEDIGYGFKKESYGLGIKALEDATKRKYDAAIAGETNALEREKLKQQKEMDLKKIAAMHVNPALQIAAALQNAKTPEQREAIEKGIASVYGNKPTGTTSAMLNQYYDRLKDVDKSFEGDIRKFQGPKEQQALEDAKKVKYQEVYKDFAQYGIGPMAQGKSTAGAETTGQVKFLGYEK
jgi:hypothetical protein